MFTLSPYAPCRRDFDSYALNVFDIPLFYIFVSWWAVFFIQAEDDIRDYKVTGVQTCALPISRIWRDSAGCATCSCAAARLRFRVSPTATKYRKSRRWTAAPVIHARYRSPSERVLEPHEIGRASCRERV